MTKKLTIALTPAAIAKFGATRAVMLQQLREWPEYHPELTDGEGWFTASSEDLAEITGLTAATCRQQIPKLVADGLVERRENISSHGQGKNRYRATVDRDGNRLNLAPTQTSRPGPTQTRTPGPAETSRPSSVLDVESGDSPHSPPGGEPGGPASLFDEDPSTAGCSALSERKRKATNPMVEAWFGEWWEHDYPKGKRGSRAEALKRFAREIRNGRNLAEIQHRTRHYVEARNLYRTMTGDEAPLLHGTTFLNGRLDDWGHLWTEEDVETSKWPTGKRAEKPKTVAEMLAEADDKVAANV